MDLKSNLLIYFISFAFCTFLITFEFVNNSSFLVLSQTTSSSKSINCSHSHPCPPPSTISENNINTANKDIRICLPTTPSNTLPSKSCQPAHNASILINNGLVSVCPPDNLCRATHDSTIKLNINNTGIH